MLGGWGGAVDRGNDFERAVLDHLLRSGRLTAEQSSALQAMAADGHGRVLDLLVEKGVVTRPELEAWWARSSSAPASGAGGAGTAAAPAPPPAGGPDPARATASTAPTARPAAGRSPRAQRGPLERVGRYREKRQRCKGQSQYRRRRTVRSAGPPVSGQGSTASLSEARANKFSPEHALSTKPRVHR